MFLGLMFCNIGTMIFLIAFLAVLLVADLFKRHLLSNPIVYAITMLVVPLAFLVAVATPVFALVEKTFLETILYFVLGILLLVLAAVIYIRGHIVPVNKSAVITKHDGNVSYYAAKRLIVTGSAISAVYGILLIVQSSWLSSVFVSFFGSDIVSIFQAVIFWLLSMLVPLVNIFVALIFVFFGAELLMLGMMTIMFLLPNMLVTNGCIRCIVRSDKTKPMKALFIVLSFIPVFNIIYGIICLKRISAELK
ncbi:MAG: hypothetical protein J6K17_06295 [Oscillospiraceae bacterium]|nr:hypothetical protein [Oscillospiraceae bacterium]